MTNTEHLDRLADAVYALPDTDLGPALESLTALRADMEALESNYEAQDAALTAIYTACGGKLEPGDTAANFDPQVVVRSVAALRASIAEMERQNAGSPVIPSALPDGSANRESAAIKAARELAGALGTCHLCGAELLVDDGPTYCAEGGCSYDCEEHDEPNCIPISQLHASLKRALASLPNPESRESAASPFWLIYYEDADVQPELFTDESAAREHFARRLERWSCHLFRQVVALPTPLTPKEDTDAKLFTPEGRLRL